MIRYISFILLLLVCFSFTPSYQFYQTNITLSRVRARSYGNFKLFDSTLWTANQQTSLSVSINKVIQFYNNKPYPFRWESDYSIEYFQDSTMTTIAQILYRKVNLTHTYRYYSIRPRRGLQANKTFFLGSDTCQSCNPGRDMRLMNYKTVDIQNNQNLAFDVVNIVNSVKKMNWKMEDIKEVRLWQFPEGNFYIPVFQYANQSTYMAAILSTPSQTLTFIQGIFFPKITGNVLIDESYLYEYLYLIYDDRNLKFPAQLNTNIFYFEYFIDPVDRQATTIMLNILNSKTYYQFFGVFQQKSFNLISTAQYNKIEQVPYLTEQYFLQNTENNRMSSSITPDEYRQFSKQDPTRLSNAKILQAKYIDYPNGMRQYMLTILYNPQSINRVSLRYFLRPNTPKFNLSRQVYNRVIIYSSTSPYPWEQTWPKIYEYKREYGLLHDFERYSYTITGIGSTQMCNQFQGHFESIIWQVNQISNSPKIKRLFMKDLETNRIFLILQSPLTSSQEQGGPNFSFCSLMKIEIINTSTFERIFNALSGELTNVDGEAFVLEDLKEQLVFRLSNYGGYNFYYLSFQKNGVKSAFYIDETKKGVLTIVDYIDNVEQTGLNNYPILGSSNTTNNHNTTTNTTTQNTTTNTTNQTIPNSNQTTNNTTPKPQIIQPTINDIFISGEGTLSAQDVINRYSTLINIIKNYDTSPNLQKKPIVFIYSDTYNKIVLYAITFSYSTNVYELFQLIEIVETKQYYYSGKNYLTNLPNAYWNISDSSNQEVMQQAITLVNSYSAVANVPILKGTVKSIPTLKGGIFFANMTITNGYTVNIAFLRKQIVWERIYAYFLPPTGNNNQESNNSNSSNGTTNPGGPPQNNKPTLTEMNDSQIRSDTSLLIAFNLIKDSVTQLMSGLALSQAMRGSFSNGTLVYNLTYRSPNLSAYLIIIFYYDPVCSKILYLKTDPSTQIISVPAIVPSPTDQEMQKTVMDNTLIIYPQLSGFQTANVQWSKFPTFWICNVNLTVNGVIYYRIVQVSIPSMQVQELKFAKGGL